MAGQWQTSRWRMVLDLGTTMAILIAAGLMIYAHYPKSETTKRTLPVPEQPLSLDGAALIGSNNAGIGILLYTDFQCPFCKAFAQEVLPVLQKEYIETGRVLLAVRQFPIEKLHPFAPRAAEAAVCSSRQGRFIEFHNILFLHQKELTEGRLDSWAHEAGLDTRDFETCLQGAPAQLVKADLEGGQQLGISGTPSFFVGTLTSGSRLTVTRTQVGMIGVEQWRQLLTDAANASTRNPRNLSAILAGIVSAVLVMAFLVLRRKRRFSIE